MGQASCQFSTALNRKSALSVYHSDKTGIGYIAWFATLKQCPRLAQLVTTQQPHYLPLYTMEAYAALCQQAIDHGHGIFIMQSGLTLSAMRDALNVSIGGVINLTPLHQGARAALFYIMRQQIDPSSYAHFLCINAVQWIPGYECVYSEMHYCSGPDIVSAASQGDCPAVVSSCIINSSRVLYQQAVDLFMNGVDQNPTLMTPLNSPTVLRVAKDDFTALQVLVSYFGIGGFMSLKIIILLLHHKMDSNNCLHFLIGMAIRVFLSTVHCTPGLTWPAR
jgi:hypothetical protein